MNFIIFSSFIYVFINKIHTYFYLEYIFFVNLIREAQYIASHDEYFFMRNDIYFNTNFYYIWIYFLCDAKRYLINFFYSFILNRFLFFSILLYNNSQYVIDYNLSLTRIHNFDIYAYSLQNTFFDYASFLHLIIL